MKDCWDSVCGICGIVDERGVSESSLVRMRDTMVHRGPDDAGLYFDQDGRAGLGHRRLSIIDLSQRGRQPLSNEDGTLNAVVNGEFYGYRSQRDDLVRRGHSLASDTDSEILLHLYEDEGAECVRSLRGMFGLALWNTPQRTLLLARDRAGKKPLYYAHEPGRFAFGSELKALLTLPWVDTSIDPTALDAYLALGCVPGSQSIVAGARRLEPGTRLVYEAERDRVRIERYWSLPETSTEDISEDEALARLRELLEEATALRLISDVPVGVFLSGGVDSSVVAALAARVSQRPLKTFTIGFSETSHNEMPFARRVAEHIGSEHHELLVSMDMLDVVEALPSMYDEPFADSSAVPTYYVSKATRSAVKVALSGDGGDELFGGYNWYRWVLGTQRLRQALGPLSSSVARAAHFLPKTLKGRHFLRSVGLDFAGSFIERTFIFDDVERAKLLSPELRTALETRTPEGEARMMLDATGAGLLDAMQRRDFARYLPDDILVKVDRASMAVALEVRGPLLDQRVCEFAFALPPSVRMAGGVSKGLLKRLASQLLPIGYPMERKQGFTLPLDLWLCGSFGDVVRERVRGVPSLARLVDVKRVDSLLAEHRSGARSNTARLWALLVLAVWVEARG